MVLAVYLHSKLCDNNNNLFYVVTIKIVYSTPNFVIGIQISIILDMRWNSNNIKQIFPINVSFMLNIQRKIIGVDCSMYNSEGGNSICIMKQDLQGQMSSLQLYTMIHIVFSCPHHQRLDKIL